MSIITEMWQVILSCLILSILLAPIGSISLWRGYGYLGDSLAHSSVLASVIISITSWPLIPVVSFVTVSIAIVIYSLEKGNNIYVVTNIVASTAIALSIILSRLFPQNIILTNILIGDALSATKNNLLMLLAVTIISFTFIFRYFNQLVLLSLSQDLAKIYHIKVRAIEFTLLLLAAVIISLGVKIVGMLLLNSLLIMPAASARLISNTPYQMIWVALLIAVINNLLGLFFSILFDLPLAATISLSFFICFIILYIFNRVRLF